MSIIGLTDLKVNSSQMFWCSFTTVILSASEFSLFGTRGASIEFTSLLHDRPPIVATVTKIPNDIDVENETISIKYAIAFIKVSVYCKWGISRRIFNIQQMHIIGL